MAPLGRKLTLIQTIRQFPICLQFSQTRLSGADLTVELHVILNLSEDQLIVQPAYPFIDYLLHDLQTIHLI